MATWLHWLQKPGYLNVLPLVWRHPSNKQKLLIYKVGVCPRLAWLLIIEEFPISWVEKHLDSLASKLSHLSQLLTSRDTCVRHMADKGLQKDLTLTRFKFRASKEVRDAMSLDPNFSGKRLAKVTKGRGGQ